MVAKDINQVIQIVNGKFSPVEANEMLHELVKSRISYDKVQMLKMWISDNHFDSRESNYKIDAMNKGKAEAMALIEKAKREGLKVEIIGNIEVRLSH